MECPKDWSLSSYYLDNNKLNIHIWKNNDISDREFHIGKYVQTNYQLTMYDKILFDKMIQYKCRESENVITKFFV